MYFLPMRKKLLFSFLLMTFIVCCGYAQRGTLEKAVNDRYQHINGGIVRGDTTKKELAIVFTGHEHGDGGEHILDVLQEKNMKASFFFTGDFYQDTQYNAIIRDLKAEGHYLGAHSDRHLLYCDWNNRDSLLVSKQEFLADLEANYQEMVNYGIAKADAKLFMPPFEWYNDSISQWTKEAGLQLINFTYGTLSHADYTTPEMENYKSSQEIWNSIVKYESSSPNAFNGFILLIHIGTAPERKDKFYNRLDELISWFLEKGYELKRIDELISID